MGESWSGRLSILEDEEEDRKEERRCPPAAMLTRLEMNRAAGRRAKADEEAEEAKVTDLSAWPILVCSCLQQGKDSVSLTSAYLRIPSEVSIFLWKSSTFSFFSLTLLSRFFSWTRRLDSFSTRGARPDFKL